MEKKRKISANEVISQLKDEGDFDKIRLKIIRKVKENEELRNSIMSAVKQSEALNRPGAEKLKPRQLSDAIHDEIGDNVKNQISDVIWSVIRSNSGVEEEIRETVKSVYTRLLNPKGKEVDESSFLIGPRRRDNEVVNNTSLPISASERENNMSVIEPEGPPGFDLCNPQSTNSEVANKEETQPVVSQYAVVGVKVKEESNHENEVSQFNNDLSIPPGFGSSANSKEPSYISDDDPEFPPGFGRL